VILAGDIGGTKTRLGLFERRGVSAVASRTYRTADFDCAAQMLASFLAALDARPTRACFGVAGPVVERRVDPINVPWAVDAAELETELGLASVALVNDVEANARGINGLRPRDLAILNLGAPGATGTRAVVSAGTGLGEAALWWDGTTHRPAPGEGGSSAFAPRSELEIDLFRFLAAEQGRVNVGHLLSGPGLARIYRFLGGGGEAPDPAAITAQADDDRGSVASAAVDLFVSIYGARASDVALTYGATGGVYLGGGIAPRLVSRMLEGGFMRAFVAEGRLEWYLRRMPVRVVLNADAALIGAALFAQDALPVDYPLAA
jgi:glucokinase